MSTLGAFFRGAAGPGLLALADTYERRDLEEAKANQRAAELKAEQTFRADQAKQDRMARYGSDGAEPGMLAAGRRSTAGAGGSEGGGGNINQAVADYARDNRVSMAQAQADLQASLTGIPNRTKQTVTNDADRDGRDRRTGTGATTRTDPDEERMVQVWAAAGKAFSEAGPRAKSNYAQLTEGDGNAQRNKITGGMLSGALTPATAAEAVAASKGDGAYGKGNVNQFTGTPDAIGKSVINENQAQAGSAGRANRDGDPLAKLPPAVQATIKQLDAREKEILSNITKVKAEAGAWEPAKNPGQAELQTELAAVRIKQRQVLAQYMPEAAAAKPGADPLGLFPTKPAANAATLQDRPAAQADARKAEPKAAETKPAGDPLAGLNRQQLREKRQQLEADLKRWEGKPGAEKVLSEIRDLIDRIDTGRV